VSASVHQHAHVALRSARHTFLQHGKRILAMCCEPRFRDVDVGADVGDAASAGAPARFDGELHADFVRECRDLSELAGKRVVGCGMPSRSASCMTRALSSRRRVEIHPEVAIASRARNRSDSERSLPDWRHLSGSGPRGALGCEYSSNRSANATGWLTGDGEGEGRARSMESGRRP
jgi:hypothetical protein